MKSKTLFYLILFTLLISLIPALHAQTFSVIHTFTLAEGGYSSTGVTIRENALYGATAIVYQLTHSGSNWSFSSLAALPGSSSRVVFGPDGHLYGTSNILGMYGAGTVFKLTPQLGPCKDAACYWTVNDLHDFGLGTDGREPYGDLIWDQQGNMYGTTGYGGTQNCDFGSCGTVYELTPSGNGYTESVLYNFSGPDGANPSAGLVFDNKGNLFGTTRYGGSNGVGTVFELTYVPGVGWTEHVLYSFQNASDGEVPAGGLIFDASGNLYGTTSDGGSGGGGTVFELSPAGDNWAFKLLYSFTSIYGPGCGPTAALTLDGADNLYGTTYCDGPENGTGNVFKLSNTQNGWVYTSLHDFTGGTDGLWPKSNVSIDTDGTLYGTTRNQGDEFCGCGTVWMIKP